MNNEALELMEEIINEVSVKRWKEAAANSLDARKEAAQNTAKYAEQSWDTYEEGSRKHPEEEDALYRRAWRDDIIAKKAEEKEDHAHDVLSVKAKGKSANKAIKAARASQDKRDKEYMQNSDPEKFNKLRVRTMKADQLVSADPVKSRANEALEIMEEIISEVSDEKAQKALDAARQRYDRENYEASMKLFKGDKKGAEEDGEKSAEKFNKHLNLQLKRAERKGEKLVQDKDDHDYFRISNEAFSLMEQIVDFADNLFELDLEQKQNISPNKVSRVKKDKNGEKVEVVSVADELFPYEGDAKQQFNQKVLAKINDMIEGTGSLEDLIQFVRKGVAMKKQAAHEGYNEVEQLIEQVIDEFLGLGNVKKDPVKSNPLAKELRGKEAIYNKHVDDEIKYTDRAKGAKGYRAQVNQERAIDAGRKAEAAHKDLRKSKSEILDGLRKRGATNPQAHEIVNRMVETLEIAEGLFKKDERGDLLDDIDTALGSPVKKKLADIKAKMTGCKETKVHEALELIEEIMAVVEGRKEGENQEDFKKRLAGELANKYYDKYVDSQKKALYSEKHDRKHGYKLLDDGSKRTQKLNKEVYRNYSKADKTGSIQMGMKPMSPKEKKDVIDQNAMSLQSEIRAKNK